jgi:hypothetical protein
MSTGIRRDNKLNPTSFTQTNSEISETLRKAIDFFKSNHNQVDYRIFGCIKLINQAIKNKQLSYEQLGLRFECYKQIIKNTLNDAVRAAQELFVAYDVFPANKKELMTFLKNEKNDSQLIKFVQEALNSELVSVTEILIEETHNPIILHIGNRKDIDNEEMESPWDILLEVISDLKAKEPLFYSSLVKITPQIAEKILAGVKAALNQKTGITPETKIYIFDLISKYKVA